MPTYEYKCDTCDEVFEIFHSISADPKTECPSETCNGKVTRMISSGAGMLFKGSGFYETDYRSSSYKKGADKAKDSGSKNSKDSSSTKK